MSGNMDLWDSVKETAHSAGKAAKVDGQQITSINGTYMVQRATEVFGPVGKGWGYRIVEERFDNAGPVYSKSADGGQEVIGTHMIHTLRLELWYVLNGERCTVEHFGHTPFTYRSKYGLSVDDNAPKKSLTDAIKKCLSMLGFSADVFLGEWDDRDYVSTLRTKEEIKQAEDSEKAQELAYNEFISWCEQEITVFSKVPNPSAMKTLHSRYEEKIKRRCSVLGINPDKFLKRFKEEFEKCYEAARAKKASADATKQQG